MFDERREGLELKWFKGWGYIVILASLISGGATPLYAQRKCVECHKGYQIPENSAHFKLSCTQCHFNIELRRHPGEKEKVPELKICANCHKKSVTAVLQGVHLDLSCGDCHGDAHRIPLPVKFKPEIPKTCGNCHEEVLKEYYGSIHWNAYKSGNDDAPLCTDCHGYHLIKSTKDTTSPIYPLHVPNTCAGCHDDKRITSMYGLVGRRLSTYLKSYHGIALRSGILTAATCVSCHNAHLVLPSSDKRSPTNPSNLVRTCGKCHPQATETFVKGKIHVEPRPEVSPGVFAVRSFYTGFIAVLLLLFLLHILMDIKKRFSKGEDL